MFQLRLKLLRENKGLSQAAMAKDLNISQSTIGMWENGTNRPTFKKLEELATYFDVSIDYLLGNSNVKHAGESQSIDDDIMFALFGGAEGITQKDIDDVKNFANFIKEQKKKQ